MDCSGEQLGTARPTDLFPTDIYTGEYDGVSDFPDDLSNLLSVANAVAGMEYVHLATRISRWSRSNQPCCWANPDRPTST
jgi:PE-PPE domain